MANAITGTDHPFFPPVGEDKTEWLSVATNYQAIKNSFQDDPKTADKILGNNAMRIMRLEGRNT